MASKSVPGTVDLAARRSSTADSKLLEMIVCVRLSDRLEAMQIRDSDGPEAAIKFIRDTCTLTNESYTPSVEVANAEIRRQFEQSFALVTAALDQVNDAIANDNNLSGTLGVTRQLLDMAQDELADLQYINRVDPPEEATAEVTHG